MYMYVMKYSLLVGEDSDGDFLIIIMEDITTFLEINKPFFCDLKNIISKSFASQDVVHSTLFLSQEGAMCYSLDLSSYREDARWCHVLLTGPIF